MLHCNAITMNTYHVLFEVGNTPLNYWCIYGGLCFVVCMCMYVFCVVSLCVVCWFVYLCVHECIGVYVHVCVSVCVRA
jgi:hypothetical protein